MVQDDWILRFAGGYTKRANSVNALAPARDTAIAALQRRIADAEAHYARQSIRCVFRVTPLMDPRIDTLLEARGWTAFEESLVMVTTLGDGPRASARVRIAPRRTPSWSAGYMAFSDVRPERQAIHDRIIDAIVPEAGFAEVLDEDGIAAAIGLGIVERSHIGLVDIVSDPARWRTGHGRRLVEGLLAWGRARGATHAWLQVVAGNERAIALYRQFGFRETYRYHYRAAPA
jgi:ribosomal protein S18 acetylase RimI-like enzyme